VNPLGGDPPGAREWRSKRIVPIRSGSDASSDGSTVAARADGGDDALMGLPAGDGRADGGTDPGDPGTRLVGAGAGDGELEPVALGVVGAPAHPQATNRLSVTAAATPRVCMPRLYLRGVA
jgi:hypothetical protein